MDILCHDYNQEANVYLSCKGKKLLDSKDIFLSRKLKHTFSGYAISQLKRIKGHNKWIVEYPETDIVLAALRQAFVLELVDFNWICDHFGGQAAEKVTGQSPQGNTKCSTCISWEDFKVRVKSSDNPVGDLEKYRVPQLIDYCTARDLESNKIDMKSDCCVAGCGGESNEWFVKNDSSFRILSPSMLVIYSDGKGIFTKEGQLKSSVPEKIGEFVFLLQINHTEYKKDRDHLVKMWHWKMNRNEKRGSLEEKFGYDTKHASHLVRLMEGCKGILKTGVYTTELHGDRLKFVNDVRDGKYEYEWILKYAEKLDKYLDELYQDAELQKEPKRGEVNDLVLGLQKRVGL